MRDWLAQPWSYLTRHLGWFADWASLLGLGLSLVGFALTIRYVRKTRREVHAALRRIGDRLFEDDLALSLKLVGEAQDASRSEQWTRAVDRCILATTHLTRLGRNPRLDATEKDQLVQILGDLRIITQAFDRLDAGVRKKKLTPNESKKMREMIVHLGVIQGRLREKDLEVF